ncbi:hypothetical protein [Streptomyces sp. NPDC047928]
MIDDLDEYAKAHGIKHDVQRTGLTEHVHWSVDRVGRQADPWQPVHRQ